MGFSSQGVKFVVFRNNMDTFYCNGSLTQNLSLRIIIRESMKWNAVGVCDTEYERGDENELYNRTGADALYLMYICAMHVGISR